MASRERRSHHVRGRLVVSAGRAQPAQRCICRRSIGCCRRAPRRSTTALAPRVDTRAGDGDRARSWRRCGGWPAIPAYDRSIDSLRRLTAAAFAGAARAVARRVETFENTGQGWEQRARHARARGRRRAEVRAVARAGSRRALHQLVLDAARRRRAAADRRRRRPPRRTSTARTSRARVVLGDGAVGHLWNRAVRERGAAGVVSTDLARYTQPETHAGRAAVGQHSVRRGAAHRLAFKATPRAARRLRERAGGRACARARRDRHAVSPRAQPHARRGDSRQGACAAERVVLVAHVQEPGANDNASGSGTLLAAALAIATARSRAARFHRRTHADVPVARRDPRQRALDQGRSGAGRDGVAMMSLDMTGEDTAKTGGTFLIEKIARPVGDLAASLRSALRVGRRRGRRDLVTGHFLNDLHLAVCLRRARDTGWIVRTNPYEGGSDHTVFTRAGVPALLNWHFTDRYYHTNLDTRGQDERRSRCGHVATVVATTALFLASADATDAALATLVNEAERARLETEQANAARTRSSRRGRSGTRKPARAWPTTCALDRGVPTPRTRRTRTDTSRYDRVRAGYGTAALGDSLGARSSTSVAVSPSHRVQVSVVSANPRNPRLLAACGAEAGIDQRCRRRTSR